MLRTALAVSTAVVLLTLSSGPISADVVELRSGQRAEGKVLVVSPEVGVVLERAGKKVWIRLDRVRAIHFDVRGSALTAPVTTTARLEKAQADARTLGAAVRMYSTTFGQLPPALDVLTRRSEIAGTTGGPFLPAIPAPPEGWSPYEYVQSPNGEFTITTTGDGTMVRVP